MSFFYRALYSREHLVDRNELIVSTFGESCIAGVLLKPAMEDNSLREIAIRVSQYFLDFLESDFKRQQAPRRRLTLQMGAGFRAGMQVSPIPLNSPT